MKLFTVQFSEEFGHVLPPNFLLRLPQSMFPFSVKVQGSTSHIGTEKIMVFYLVSTFSDRGTGLNHVKRVLRLRMEKTASMYGSCEYNE
jgi:hypothetical protein